MVVIVVMVVMVVMVVDEAEVLHLPPFCASLSGQGAGRFEL